MTLKRVLRLKFFREKSVEGHTLWCYGGTKNERVPLFWIY